jgi:pimeloyl-ACP methyl ester carboxylesterase
MKPSTVTSRELLTRDGVELAYHLVGEGRPILLANGLFGGLPAFQHQINYLEGRYRFLSWDYRGLYASPPPPNLAALSVEQHALDGIAVLDAEKIPSTILVGWSMGVQVALEIFRRAPKRVSALVLINGVAGRSLATRGAASSIGKFVVPRVLRGLRRMPAAVSAVMTRVSQWPETAAWIKRTGLASPTLDADLWQELAERVALGDMELYVRLVEAMGMHDAHDVLPNVDVPTLVITGDRDPFTPRMAAERIVRGVRGAEMMTVPGATHFLPMEYPEMLNLRMEKFFRERGLADVAVRRTSQPPPPPSEPPPSERQ